MDLIHPGQTGRERKQEAGFLGPSHLQGAGGSSQNCLSPGRIGADGAVTMVWMSKAVKEVETQVPMGKSGDSQPQTRPSPGRRDKSPRKERQVSQAGGLQERDRQTTTARVRSTPTLIKLK